MAPISLSVMQLNPLAWKIICKKLKKQKEQGLGIGVAWRSGSSPRRKVKVALMDLGSGEPRRTVKFQG